MKRYLVLGLGRMGITHLAHINGYCAGGVVFDVYDPSLVFRMASFFSVRKNIRFLRRLPTSGNYDSVVITSPPKAHSVNFNDCFDLSDSFFIEKPLSLSQKDVERACSAGKKIYCGYVLRHNPCIRKVHNLMSREVMKVEVKVSSNLGLNPGEDWRFDLTKGGGCLNELGSHAINLALLFYPESKYIVNDLILKYLTNSKFSLCLGGSPNLSIEGDWDVNVRKTTYEISIYSKVGVIHSDFQSVWGTLDGKDVSWSPRESALDVGFYLRGVDFALQNQSFVESDFGIKDLTDAVVTDDIISEALKHV